MWGGALSTDDGVTSLYGDGAPTSDADKDRPGKARKKLLRKQTAIAEAYADRRDAAEKKDRFAIRGAANALPWFVLLFSVLAIVGSACVLRFCKGTSASQGGASVSWSVRSAQEQSRSPRTNAARLEMHDDASAKLCGTVWQHVGDCLSAVSESPVHGVGSVLCCTLCPLFCPSSLGRLLSSGSEKSGSENPAPGPKTPANFLETSAVSRKQGGRISEAAPVFGREPAPEQLGETGTAPNALRQQNAEPARAFLETEPAKSVGAQAPHPAPQEAPRGGVVSILKPAAPAFQRQEYKYITLPNGLKAALVTAPQAAKAAFALAVGAGSAADPDDVPGLAHFCEHLLFMGSEKYPDENVYSEQISRGGGYTNAYTSDAITNFQGSVSAEMLAEVLDIFANFFVKPLFKRDGVARELQAVNSEHSKNIPNDNWRLHRVRSLQSLPGSLLNRFSTGNVDTLGTEPEKRGVDVIARLRDYFAKYYRADNMYLTVICPAAGFTMAELEALVRRVFGSIPAPTGPLPVESSLFAGAAASDEAGLAPLSKAFYGNVENPLAHWSRRIRALHPVIEKAPAKVLGQGTLGLEGGQEWKAWRASMLGPKKVAPWGKDEKAEKAFHNSRGNQGWCIRVPSVGRAGLLWLDFPIAMPGYGKFNYRLGFESFLAHLFGKRDRKSLSAALKKANLVQSVGAFVSDSVNGGGSSSAVSVIITLTDGAEVNETGLLEVISAVMGYLNLVREELLGRMEDRAGESEVGKKGGAGLGGTNGVGTNGARPTPFDALFDSLAEWRRVDWMWSESFGAGGEVEWATDMAADLLYKRPVDLLRQYPDRIFEADEGVESRRAKTGTTKKLPRRVYTPEAAQIKKRIAELMEFVHPDNMNIYYRANHAANLGERGDLGRVWREYGAAGNMGSSEGSAAAPAGAPAAAPAAAPAGAPAAAPAGAAPAAAPAGAAPAGPAAVDYSVPPIDHWRTAGGVHCPYYNMDYWRDRVPDTLVSALAKVGLGSSQGAGASVLKKEAAPEEKHMPYIYEEHTASVGDGIPNLEQLEELETPRISRVACVGSIVAANSWNFFVGVGFSSLS